jgi:hypothetical protein
MDLSGDGPSILSAHSITKEESGTRRDEGENEGDSLEEDDMEE